MVSENYQSRVAQMAQIWRSGGCHRPPQRWFDAPCGSLSPWTANWPGNLGQRLPRRDTGKRRQGEMAYASHRFFRRAPCGIGRFRGSRSSLPVHEQSRPSLGSVGRTGRRPERRPRSTGSTARAGWRCTSHDAGRRPRHRVASSRLGSSPRRGLAIVKDGGVRAATLTGATLPTLFGGNLCRQMHS